MYTFAIWGTTLSISNEIVFIFTVSAVRKRVLNHSTLLVVFFVVCISIFSLVDLHFLCNFHYIYALAEERVYP